MYDIIEIGLLRRNFAALFRRAATNKDFRMLCLKDANSAYLELTGQSLPEWYTIRFFEPGETPLKNEAVKWMRLPKYLDKTWLG